jgi:RNA polymerase sigma-70 factor (ECF subfamily)
MTMQQAGALALQSFGFARKGTGAMTEPVVDNINTSVSRVTEPRPQEQHWESLIRQIAQGDQQALGTFYDATSALVYGLALRVLGDMATAEEVTLDVYTQVWRQATSYSPKRGTPAAWLFMLTRSRAIDRLRSGAQEQRRFASFDAETPTAVSTPEESSVVAERRRFVQEAFAALVPEQREVIELVYFSGLSHREIAPKLGLPLGTVKTRIRLGMMKLRDLLQPLVDEL